MSKHTPGPWEVGDGSDRNLFCGSGDILGKTKRGRAVIARVNPGLKDYEANARLIAAAPEMLEALIHVRNVFPMARWADDTRAMIKAVIDKAEGRTE